MSEQLSLPVTEEWRVGDQIVRDLSDEEKRARYLDALDGAMVELYRRIVASDVDCPPWSREPPYVCGDDARKRFESWDPPSPDDLSRNFLAALWKRKHWRFIDRGHISSTEGSHGNALGRYRLDEAEYDRRMA